MKTARYALIGFFFALFALLQAQNTSQDIFGKNRVQFHEIFEDWSQYETEHFIVYWYGEGRYIGQVCVQLAEHEIGGIEQFLNHRINDKIEVLVYTDLTDLKQSNLGSDEVLEFVDNATIISGSKIFVYYDGSYEHLRKQLREGIAGIYVSSLLYGSNLQEVLQNALTLDLPDWFVPGLVAYVAENWNTRLDDELRTLILSGQVRNFNDLARQSPRLAGQALWHFVGINHSANTVSNLLYLTRINRSADQGFSYVLDADLNAAKKNCFNYFRERYKGELRDMQPPEELPQLTEIPLHNRRDLQLYHLSVSPDGRYLAYATNDEGKIKVWLQDLHSGKVQKLFQKGYRFVLQATDYNYPLLAWSPNGSELGIIYEHRDLIHLERHVMETGEVLKDAFTTQYQRIYSFVYYDADKLLFTAAVRGLSDVFIYDTKSRQTKRITQDPWDDLNARLVNIGGRKGLIWASNRPDSILRKQKLDTIPPHGRFDLFYLDLSLGSKERELVRLTNTPAVDETSALGIDEHWFSFLSDQSGISNRYYGYLEDYIHHYERIVRLQNGEKLVFHPDTLWEEKVDSSVLAEVDSVWLHPVIKQRAVVHAATNYNTGIREQQAAGNELFELLYFKRSRKDKRGYHLYRLSANPLQEARPTYTFFRRKEGVVPPQRPLWDAVHALPQQDSLPALHGQREEGTVPADTLPPVDMHYFQSEFEEVWVPEEQPAEASKVEEEEPPAQLAKTAVTKASSERWYPFRPSTITPYRLRFKIDYVGSDMSNEPLFEGLNSFSGVPQASSFQPPGLLMRGLFKDVLEDHALEIGMRLPTSFNGVEFYAIYDDKRRRLDRRYAAYYNQRKFVLPVEIPTPLLPETRVTTFLLQNEYRYPFDVFSRLQATLTWRVDQVVEKASDPATLNAPTLSNHHLGLRLSYVFDNSIPLAPNLLRGLRARAYFEGIKGFGADFSQGLGIEFNSGFTGVAGLDFRYYQYLWRDAIVAFRLSGGASFGSEKILYYLGGTENWLIPAFNNQTPIDGDANYAWQVPVGSLRGFRQNIRNGNSYALANVELRWPLFRFLFPNIRSPFWRNLQLMGFFDLGTAWAGKSPFAPDSPLNTRHLPDPPVNSYPVQVTVHYFRNPVVWGYGAGLRLPLFGYFLRIDYAQGIETNMPQKPRLYLSLGYDF